MGKYIVATFTIKPEKREEALAHLQLLVEGSQAEPGNTMYVLTQCAENPNSFMILEHWKSEEAIAQHGNTPHLKQYLSVRDNFIDHASINLLTPIKF